MSLVERVKAILLKPQEEWPVIAAESADVKTLYTTYIMLLAAIPALAGFISLSFYSSFLGRLGGGFGMGFALTSAIMGYAVSLASVYLIALLADALAPSFDGEKNFIQSFKLATYALTAGWVGGALNIIPFLGGLLALLCSLYGIYVLYLGVIPMKNVPADKAAGYTVVLVIAAVVVMGFLGMITGGIVAASLLGGAMSLR